MDILKLLTSDQGQQLLSQLSSQFNLSEDDAKKAVSELAPAVQKGMETRVKNDGSAESIFAGQEKVLQDILPEDKPTPSVNQLMDSGNQILGAIFGSKDISREVAQRASNNTGLDIGALKSMLPLIASVTGGALLNKSSSGNGLTSILSSVLGRGNKINASSLINLLDQDNDGSVADDLMDLAKKFMK